MDELSGEITASLGRVSYNGGRALVIVERMRSLSAEGGTPVLTDLNAVLRQATQQGRDTLETEFEDFHVDLQFVLDDSIGEQMLAERDFGEAVVNLVSNACFAMQTKHQKEGDGYAPRLTVSSILSDSTVEVRVRDNGPGISEENVGRIFNPFFSTREGALGAALGLPSPPTSPAGWAATWWSTPSTASTLSSPCTSCLRRGGRKRRRRPGGHGRHRRANERPDLASTSRELFRDT